MERKPLYELRFLSTHFADEIKTDIIIDLDNVTCFYPFEDGESKTSVYIKGVSGGPAVICMKFKDFKYHFFEYQKAK